MCLAVPGKVVEFVEAETPFVSAMVEFGAIRRLVSLACVPEASVGDFVMVHAGIAISRVNEREAARVFEVLEQLDFAEDSEPPWADTSQSFVAPTSKEPRHEVR